MADETYTVVRGAQFVQAVRAAADLYDLDALAVFADALREGLGGGIGYEGTRYGPWQIKQEDIPIDSLANGPRNSIDAQAWAWSASGVEWQLGRMSLNGAHGKHGHLAVAAIVHGVEDPQDPATAIAARQGVYDSLLARGDDVWAYLASVSNGPSLGPRKSTRKQPGTVDTTPAPAPGAGRHAGASWRALTRTLLVNVPMQAQHLGAVARRLPRSIL